MNNLQVFGYIFDQIETPFLDNIGALVLALINFAAVPVQIALVIYIALTGMLIMRGHFSAGVDGLLSRLAAMVLVVWFATNGSVYTAWVQDFFLTALPKGITNAVISAGNTGTTVDANTFDVIWKKAFDGGLKVWRLLGTWDWGEAAVVILFWGAAIFACIVAFAIWFCSHVILGLFVIIGPLVIGLVLFPATKPIFERWIGAMIGCVILQVGVVIMVTLTMQVESMIVAKIANYTGSNPFEQIRALMAAIIFFMFAGVITYQLPGWASSLAGGLQFHTGAIARAMSGAAARTGEAGKELVKQTSRGATFVGQKAVQGTRVLYQRIRPPAGGSLSSSSTPRT